MKLIINGEEKILHVATIHDIVEHYNLDKGLVVIEADGKIIERELWEVTEVVEGMKIELVQFVGGG